MKYLLIALIIGMAGCKETPLPAGPTGCIMACNRACWDVRTDRDQTECITKCISDVMKAPSCREVPVPVKVEAEPVPMPPPSGE